jgi:hypothetical protein
MKLKDVNNGQVKTKWTVFHFTSYKRAMPQTFGNIWQQSIYHNPEYETRSLTICHYYIRAFF